MAATQLLDRKTLLPDRRGNDCIDSLRNIVADPRVALLFSIRVGPDQRSDLV